MTNKIYKFDSGLTLMYCKNTVNNATNLNICFDCGARCDGELAGLSHFCEHMFFTGTKELSKQEISKKYLDFIRTNAYTSGEHITFTGEIFTNKLADYLDTVVEMILKSRFNKQSVEEEKKVVIQEIVRGYNDGEQKAYDLFKYEIYGDEYYKNGVLGSEKSVKQITSKDVRNYVKKYFVNNNCYIYICSPLSFSKVKKIISDHFESKMRTNGLSPLPHNKDTNKIKHKLAIYNNSKINKVFLKFAFKVDCDIKNIDARNSYVLLSNLIGDMGDGLFKKLRLDNSLVYAVNSDWITTKNTICIIIETVTSKENINPCIDVITDYLRELKQNGITQEMLDKIKVNENYYWQTQINTPSHAINKLSTYRIYNRYVSDKELHNSYQNMSLKRLNQAVDNIYYNSAMVAFANGNITKKDMYTLKEILSKLKV